MHVVNLINDTKTEIHGTKAKLKTGSVVQGINAIDSFSFAMFPSNPGFDRIHDFQTLVMVFNTNKNRYEFQGRVLCSNDSMDNSGLITKEVTCESFFGFLCDSQQLYVEEKNWTVRDLFTHIVDVHNSQVEEYKHFYIGEITVTDPNDNVYIGIQRDNSWKTIEEKLLKTLGGEIRFRVVDGLVYIDYMKEIGEEKTTAIELSRNMKTISREIDPSAYITRLIPLGCKLKDAEGNETEQRLDITSVNGGLNYIDDEAAIESYGIHVGYIEFDDVTEPANLLRKGLEWLEENNKVQIRYSISALDLSLLGLDIDSFDVHNYHPIKNALLGIDDVARIIKKTINVCEEISSTIEVGDNFKTLSDIQQDQAAAVTSLSNSVNKIEREYVTNTSMETKIENTVSKELEGYEEDLIETVSTLLVEVLDDYVLQEEHEAFKKTVEDAFEQYVLTSDFDDFKTTVTSALAECVSADVYTEFEQSVNGRLDALEGVIAGEQKILWSGASMMTAEETIELTKEISLQSEGVELVFSPYSNDAAVDTDFKHFRVSKTFVAQKPGVCSRFEMSTVNFGAVCGKSVYIYDNKITGDDNNNTTGTGASGITYDNSAFVLRYVFGV